MLLAQDDTAMLQDTSFSFDLRKHFAQGSFEKVLFKIIKADL